MSIIELFFDVIQNLGTTNIILLLTALILALYTSFTFRLWREIKIQTDLLQMPFIILRFDRKASRFYLKNIGKSIATKVKLEGYTIITTDVEKEFKIEFDLLDLLEPDEEKKITYNIFENGKKLSEPSEFAVYFFPIVPSEARTEQRPPAIFRITYKNMFGLAYFQDILVDSDEYRIKRFGRHNLHKRLWREIFLKLQAIMVNIVVWHSRRKHNRKIK